MTLSKAPASSHSSPDATGGGRGAEAAGNQAGEHDAGAILHALAGALLQTREEAKNWRAQCGIENDWDEDEAFYDARDRGNPEGESNVGKPLSPDGGAENRPIVAAGRSSVFIPITRAYVDGASARVSDMLLPNDDPPWELKPTPIPSMEVSGGLNPIAAASAEASGGAAPPAAGPAGMGGTTGMPAPTDPAQAGAEAATFESPDTPDDIMQALPEDKKRAERAKQVIKDWHIECQWSAEARKMIEDAALLGTGILKGPFPFKKKSIAFKRDPATGTYSMVEQSETKPITKRVHPRNLWFDPAGGEDHQAGGYCWELDAISGRHLRNLLNDETYIHENVLRALKEGPGNKSDRPDTSTSTDTIIIGATYPLWYFYGDIDKKTMIAGGVPADLLPEGEDEQVAISAMVIMVNDLVVKVAQTPLDAGGFPYDVFPWQRRPGIPWGKGVARQVRTPQRMLNAAVRAMMDNAALTSGPLYAIRQDWIYAIDGDNATITPRKGFYMSPLAPPTAKIDDAISFTNVPANTEELNNIIDRAQRFAEDATGMPMLMQGQQGDATTTATGMQILNNNGSTVLRRIARTFDDRVTEPHIRRYYYWLMANKGHDDAKGDFQIDARGSTYLVDRELQAQHLNMLYPLLIQNPDIHPGRLGEEVAIANRLPIERIKLTPEEKRQRDSQPPQELPQVQVARIKQETDKARMQLEDAHHGDEMKMREGELQQKVEAALATIAKDLNVSEDSVKAMLAVAVMNKHSKDTATAQQGAVAAATRAHQSGEAGKDRAHERVSGMEQRNHEATMTPPAEKPGKAPNGAAFAQ